MGTSADYSAPPNWGDLKADVTRKGKLPRLTDEHAGNLLKNFLGHGGGSAGISSGGGQLGSGETARRIARNFGGFVSLVANVGLSEALRQNNLQELIGRSVQETLLGILSLCGGTDGAIDSTDARNAFSETMDELCRDAETSEDLEAALGGLINGVQMVALLMSFFAKCLFEQFCRVFFSQLIQKHGEEKAGSFLRDISDYIMSRLEQHSIEHDATGIDWFGNEGAELSGRIMQDTLAIFES